jgi:MFS family permease
MQTLPVLLLAPYGGLVVDRVDKRRLLLGTQVAFAVLAALLGVLTLSGTIRLWMVLTIATALGVVNSVDNPARQAFVPEMVRPDELPNAVTLNSVITNAARAIGPAIAGILIVTVGVGECFLLNAASFLAVLVALATMRRSQLHPARPAGHGPGQLLEGLRYVRGDRRLLVPLLMMALIGALSYEFQVVLPLLAQRDFAGGADAYGYLTAAFGAGALAGGVLVAGRAAPGLRSVVAAAGMFGVTLLGAAATPQFWSELTVLAAAGAASVAFMSRGTSLLELTAVESMRGRVMALWAVALIGTTPIGGPVVGYVAEHAGPRWGLAVGGIAALVAAATVVGVGRRRSRGPSALTPAPPAGIDSVAGGISTTHRSSPCSTSHLDSPAASSPSHPATRTSSAANGSPRRRASTGPI